MPTSIREQILVEFKNKLDALKNDITGLSVYRNRNKEVSVNNFPALVMIDGSQQVDQENGSTYATRYYMDIHVEGMVNTTTDDALGSTYNDIYAQLITKIAEDFTLGNLAVDVMETETLLAIDRGEGKQPAAIFNVTFNVTYQTLEGDPYQLT